MCFNVSRCAHSTSDLFDLLMCLCALAAGASAANAPEAAVAKEQPLQGPLLCFHLQHSYAHAYTCRSYPRHHTSAYPAQLTQYYFATLISQADVVHDSRARPQGYSCHADGVASDQWCGYISSCLYCAVQPSHLPKPRGYRRQTAQHLPPFLRPGVKQDTAAAALGPQLEPAASHQGAAAATAPAVEASARKPGSCSHQDAAAATTPATPATPAPADTSARPAAAHAAPADRTPPPAPAAQQPACERSTSPVSGATLSDVLDYELSPVAALPPATPASPRSHSSSAGRDGGAAAAAAAVRGRKPHAGVCGSPGDTVIR